MSNLKALDHENLSNTVYATLCDALIKGKFHPGDRLRIREIAEQLGTSVTPVRDAILRLVHDDALVFWSARDIRVPIISEDRYLEIRSIRLRLEALAAETAAQMASRQDLATLEDILGENEKAIGSQDRLRGAELNQAFHFMLPTIAGLPMLHSMLRRIWVQMGPVIADAYVDGGRSMIDYHYPIVEAIRRHDSTAAATAIMDDIVQGGIPILEHLKAAAA